MMKSMLERWQQQYAARKAGQKGEPRHGKPPASLSKRRGRKPANRP